MKNGFKLFVKLGYVATFLKRRGSKKGNWPNQKKQEFTEVLTALLMNEFSLNQALTFMVILLPKEARRLAQLNEELLAGESLSEAFYQIGYSEYEQMVVYLGEVRGDIVGAFSLVEQRLIARQHLKNEARKVLSYPLVLVVFLGGILWTLRTVILPEVQQTVSPTGGFRLSFWVINWGPEVLLLLLVVIVGSLVVFRVRMGKVDQLSSYRWLTKVPVLGHYLKVVLTIFFADEVGKLLSHGLEMQDVVNVLGQDSAGGLSQEFSRLVKRAYQKGINWGEALEDLPFLTRELSYIVHLGEAKGNLGKELCMYSQRLQKKVTKQLEKSLVIIQPLIFIAVALVILMVYGALLLPIYQEMEGLI